MNQVIQFHQKLLRLLKSDEDFLPIEIYKKKQVLNWDGSNDRCFQYSEFLLAWQQKQ